MAPEPSKTALPPFRLPATIAEPADVARLTRELESLENYLYQAGIRHTAKAGQLPKTSRPFDDITGLNKLDMILPTDRRRLAAFLQVLQTKAPVLHVSFSVAPSSAFVARIVVWLRQNVSPFVLVRIGVQPTLGGGCVVRTTNRRFDFSFRQYLSAQRPELVKAIARVAAR